MVRQLPKTESMNISDVESSLSHVVRQVHEAQVRILVEESGIPVAALISVDDLARFAELEREHDARFAVIDRARAAFHDIPATDIEAETDRIIARLRADNRAVAEDEAASG